MATNTLGTTNGILIAQNALATLLALLPVLKNITTDFSDQKILFGQTLITHIVTAAPAVDFDPTVGYVAQGRAQIDVPVTINKHKHHTYEIGVQEASSTHIDLIQRFALTAAYSIGQALVQDLCALVTAANFPAYSALPLGSGGDGFDRKAVIKCGTALSTRKVQPYGRFMLLNPLYKGSIENDIRSSASSIPAKARSSPASCRTSTASRSMSTSSFPIMARASPASPPFRRRSCSPRASRMIPAKATPSAISTPSPTRIAVSVSRCVSGITPTRASSNAPTR